MRITRTRSAGTRLAAGIVTAGLLVGLAACSSADDGGGSDEAVTAGPDGTDDGTTLTLWTRAPLEKQAKLLVDAYNESHENQVELTVVPNDDYVAKVGAAAGSDGLPDLFAADIVYVPNWVQQGLFQDLTDADRRPRASRTRSTRATSRPAPPTARSTCCRSCSTCRCCSGTRTSSPRPASTRRRRRPTSTEYAEAAKAVQALNKPDTYGTATGLNCGGCLVFTWFPSVWADGEEVMTEDGTESLLDERHGQGGLLHVEGPLGLRRGAPVVRGRGRSDVDRRLHRGQGRPDVLPGDAAVVDHGLRRRRGRHPRPGGRRLDVRRR